MTEPAGDTESRSRPVIAGTRLGSGRIDRIAGEPGSRGDA